MTTHAPAEATSHVNPHHTLSEEAQESLRALAEADRRAVERRAEAEQRGRPTEEERAQVADMWSTVARSIGVDVDMVRRTLGDVRDRRAQRAAGEDRTFAGETTEVVQREPMVFDAPEPIDHSFWAATFNFGGDGGPLHANHFAH